MNAKLFFSLALCLFLGTSLTASNPTTVAILNYVESHHEIATQEMKKSGIPASILLAQAIILSEQGSAEILQSENNHFALECGYGWNGKAVFKKEDGSVLASCFRTYSDAASSYQDYTKMLMEDVNCRALFQHSYYDYESWAKGLASCMHATDIDYADQLIKLIRKYELHKYDSPESFSPVLQKPIIGYEFQINK